MCIIYNFNVEYVNNIYDIYLIPKHVPKLEWNFLESYSGLRAVSWFISSGECMDSLSLH